MRTEVNMRMEGFAFLVAFIACIPAANWFIQNVGTFCTANGPCVIPVAPHLTAPSGVLLVGFALVLRDLVQRRLGKLWSLLAVLVGSMLSAYFAAPSLVVASSTTFLFSELADFAVHTTTGTPLGVGGVAVKLGRVDR
jgi:queuosine precursor transporter